MSILTLQALLVDLVHSLTAHLTFDAAQVAACNIFLGALVLRKDHFVKVLVVFCGAGAGAAQSASPYFRAVLVGTYLTIVEFYRAGALSEVLLHERVSVSCLVWL